MNLRQIKPGIYVVVDPSMGAENIIAALASALSSGVVAAVQIWDNWPDDGVSPSLLQAICSLTHARDVPVLANNRWELLLDFPLDGIHFDSLPEELAAIRRQIARPIIVGTTLSNDLTPLEQPHASELDYLSFCSMFPSTSAGQCEIVRPEAVVAARRMVDVPVFLAGGIRTDNLAELAGLPFDGIAAISGVMHDPDPEEATRTLYLSIQKLKIKTT